MKLVIPERFNIAEHFIELPAKRFPKKLAILGEPSPITYGGLTNLTSRTAAGFLALGVRPKDRVLIVLPDSIEFVAAFFGAAKIGAVAVPVNPMTRRPDYEFYVQDLEPKVCVVHEMAWSKFQPAITGRPATTIVLVSSAKIAPPSAEHSMWQDLVNSTKDGVDNFPTRASDWAFFLYTSGSGGKPKAAIHQHKDMLVTTTNYAQTVLGIRGDDVMFSVSKLFFAYGLGNSMYFPFSVGASTVYLAERPRPERVLEMVARYRPSLFFAVPTLYGAILRAAESGVAADFSSVRGAVSAGEALPPEIFEQFHKRFGLRIQDAIGSTEMLHMFIANHPTDPRAGTCGREIPGCRSKILDEAGATVGDGEIGNLYVRGESALEGYWNRPELSAATIQNGWVATGDKFFRDSEGFFHYCGRRDDMFKVSGMWVAPGEVENALLGHASVSEAAVVEGRDGAGFSVPLAYVVLRLKEEPVEAKESLLAFLRQRLPGYKCPRQIVLVSELPKTATGKIQRFRLRELASDAK